ncbi:MAG TPA: SDR family oxidoreductase [Propionibacteriaceae bacterium]
MTQPPPVRQRILITGASAGLGAEMAKQWAAAGRDLVLCARRLPELERLRAEILTDHPDVTVLIRALDVTDAEAVDRVFRETAAELGGLDRVVANAGIARGGSIGTGATADNEATVQTNFLGVLHQAESALALFRAAGAGHLVVVASMAGLRGLANEITVYAATKAGVATLAEGLQAELWHSPITVTTIYPGYIRTEINANDPNMKWSVDKVTGSAAMVAAIEREPARAYVPTRPWAFMAWPMRLMPMVMFRKLAGY